MSLNLFLACGYQFESLNPPLPEQAQSIAIAPITNDTFHASLENKVYRYLQLTFQDNDSVILASEKDADLTLSIHLKKLQTRQTNLSKQGQATASEWTLIGSIRLDKKHQILWQKEEVTIRSDLFYNQAQLKQDVTTLSKGIDSIAQKFATHVYEIIFVNF